MNLEIYFIFYSSLVTLSWTEHRDIPEFLHICKQSDPKINECIIKAIESIRPQLVTGIKDLDIPSIEPLDINDLVLLEKDRHGYLLKSKHIAVHGAGNFKINKLLDKNHGLKFDVEILLPKLQMEGLYNVNGKFLTKPIKGNGTFTGNFTNVVGFVKVTSEKVYIDDEERYSIKQLVIRVKIGKGKLELKNLFGGDKILGDVVNTAIKDNFLALTYELLPPIEKALAKKFQTIANNFLHKFTFNQLFPE